jgi:GMP reductase
VFDVVNGYMEKLVAFCKKVRENYPNKIIIAGNVVTREIIEELILNGKVDIVKVGIGPGSACTTRLKTGVGMPQLSAVLECSDAAHGVGGHIISDGGITCPGDMAKAFGGGADFVMVGGRFAGHDQNPGDIEVIDGKQYKTFHGMSSDKAQETHYGKMNTYRASEGRVLKIPYKGDPNNPEQFHLDPLYKEFSIPDLQMLYMYSFYHNASLVPCQNSFHETFYTVFHQLPQYLLGFGHDQQNDHPP